MATWKRLRGFCRDLRLAAGFRCSSLLTLGFIGFQTSLGFRVRGLGSLAAPEKRRKLRVAGGHCELKVLGCKIFGWGAYRA